jgi:signal transduction histidine kinase
MDNRKNFYLIFKEAVNNVAKYAGCTDVWISMALKNKRVLLTIKDNGKGFDVAQVNRGNGLLNMKNRAGTLKGDFKITSTPGEGTLIELSFPGVGRKSESQESREVSWSSDLHLLTSVFRISALS